MEDWKKFENDCFNYLKEKYLFAEFMLKGESDSTVSDIEVIPKANKSFFIEIKMPKAQSGQFVIIKNNNSFKFSEKNKSAKNEFTDKIIDFININYEVYEDIGTTSLNIDIENKTFSKWIIDHYMQKNVKYIITRFINDFVIFPIGKFDEYFKITGNLRCKKSGSSKIPQKYFSEIIKYLKDIDSELKTTSNNNIISICFKNKHKFYINDNCYQLSQQSDSNTFEIRKLGKTNNPTVIFSIECIKKQDNKDLNDFERFIK